MNKGDKTIRVYDPRGVVPCESLAPAPRPAELRGLRLGVLDNTKWNANRLLRATSARLAAQIAPAAVHYYRKESFSRPAAAELLERIAAECDLAITAIAD